MLFLHLNEAFLTENCKLICIDNDIVGKNNNDSRININCDIIDKEQTISTIKRNGVKNIDYIINCAGIASPKIYKKFPVETMDVSYLGTKNILDIGLKFNTSSTLCFSSSEVYGTPDKDSIPTNENYIGFIPTMSDRSCYDVGKKILETTCHTYFEKYNSQVKVLRPFNLYGPKMGINDNRVLPNFMSNILNDKPLNVYGDGKQTRTFCYIADALIIMIKLLINGKSGEIYNVGNPNPEITMLDLAKKLFDVIGKKPEIEVINYPNYYPSDEPLRRCPDITKAIRCVNYKPLVNLELGLKQMYDYYKEES